VNTSIYITAILLSIWYINRYVLTGADMRLIFVRTIALILSVSIISIIILKFTNPKDLNNDNLTVVLGLVKDMTLLITGYLFAKKD